MQYAAAYVNEVRKVIDDLPVKGNEALNGFMNNLVSFEHGVSTAMVAGMIAKKMHIESEAAIQIVGVAALLHDIGLVNMPEKCLTEDVSQMNSEE